MLTVDTFFKVMLQELNEHFWSPPITAPDKKQLFSKCLHLSVSQDWNRGSLHKARAYLCPQSLGPSNMLKWCSWKLLSPANFSSCQLLSYLLAFVPNLTLTCGILIVYPKNLDIKCDLKLFIQTRFWYCVHVPSSSGSRAWLFSSRLFLIVHSNLISHIAHTRTLIKTTEGRGTVQKIAIVSR